MKDRDLGKGMLLLCLYCRTDVGVWPVISTAPPLAEKGIGARVQDVIAAGPEIDGIDPAPSLQV